MSIVKQALEAYKDSLQHRLNMMEYYNTDYVTQIKKLQEEYDAYLARRLEVTTLIEEVDKELALHA